MALASPPELFVAVRAPARDGRPFRLIASAAVAMALLVAVVAVQRLQGSSELMQGSDEMMKGWEDGMFPPHASFPAGYHFGNDNVFGKDSSFGAGDTFGNDNVFGMGASFGAGQSTPRDTCSDLPRDLPIPCEWTI